MKSIKHALTERYYTWEDAVKLAETDPEIDLLGDGPVFKPSEAFEEEEYIQEEAAADAMEDSTQGAQPGSAKQDASLLPRVPQEQTPNVESPRL